MESQMNRSKVMSTDQKLYQQFDTISMQPIRNLNATQMQLRLNLDAIQINLDAIQKRFSCDADTIQIQLRFNFDATQMQLR